MEEGPASRPIERVRVEAGPDRLGPVHPVPRLGVAIAEGRNDRPQRPQDQAAVGDPVGPLLVGQGGVEVHASAGPEVVDDVRSRREGDPASRAVRRRGGGAGMAPPHERRSRRRRRVRAASAVPGPAEVGQVRERTRRLRRGVRRVQDGVGDARGPQEQLLRPRDAMLREDEAHPSGGDGGQGRLQVPPDGGLLGLEVGRGGAVPAQLAVARAVFPPPPAAAAPHLGPALLPHVELRAVAPRRVEVRERGRDGRVEQLGGVPSWHCLFGMYAERGLLELLAS